MEFRNSSSSYIDWIHTKLELLVYIQSVWKLFLWILHLTEILHLFETLMFLYTTPNWPMEKSGKHTYFMKYVHMLCRVTIPVVHSMRTYYDSCRRKYRWISVQINSWFSDLAISLHVWKCDWKVYPWQHILWTLCLMSGNKWMIACWFFTFSLWRLTKNCNKLWLRGWWMSPNEMHGMTYKKRWYNKNKDKYSFNHETWKIDI